MARFVKKTAHSARCEVVPLCETRDGTRAPLPDLDQILGCEPGEIYVGSKWDATTVTARIAVEEAVKVPRGRWRRTQMVRRCLLENRELRALVKTLEESRTDATFRDIAGASRPHMRFALDGLASLLSPDRPQ